MAVLLSILDTTDSVLKKLLMFFNREFRRRRTTYAENKPSGGTGKRYCELAEDRGRRFDSVIRVMEKATVIQGADPCLGLFCSE